MGEGIGIDPGSLNLPRCQQIQAPTRRAPRRTEGDVDRARTSPLNGRNPPCVEPRPCRKPPRARCVGGFRSCLPPQATHNLRKRRVDEKTVRWIASFSRSGKAVLQLREHTTELLSIDTGIPQESPISPILYLFYNADILEDAIRGTRTQ
jgi:hypothetical protein